MADDNMNEKPEKNDTKKPRTPNVGEPDPADAFKRADPTANASKTVLEPDAIEPGPKPSGNKKKRAAGETRAPRVDAAPPPDEEPPMSAEDLAAEVVTMLDGVYEIMKSLRGYDRLSLDGKTPITDVMGPDEAGKERLRKALTRLMKSAGATMSPGGAVAFGMITAYAMPIATMEFMKATAKKQGQT